MLHLLISITLTMLVVGSIVVIREAARKNLGIWLPSYLKQQWSDRVARNSSLRGPIHILFCMVDHFEPIAEGSTKEQERNRMADWLERYPVLASRHGDSDGRIPQHTWFYPGENYNAEYLDALVRLCQQGLGEIELHLHHGNDTSDSLRHKIQTAVKQFAKHGALVTREIPPRHAYGFIHGNMALDNSRQDSSLCGVNDELIVLQETGCYADFSCPTAPCVSQPRKINAIYYATDDPCRPKSHDIGVDVRVGQRAVGNLMIISGPLALNWHSRRWGILPRIENAEIQGPNPATPYRIHCWIGQNIHVVGRPNWIIVKVSCHGAEDSSRDALLGRAADELFAFLEKEYRDRAGYRLHYVTARELYNIIKAAEGGLDGDPNEYRDYAIPPYQYHGASIERSAVRNQS